MFVWGNNDYGGDNSQITGLNNVKEIYSNDRAFAALKHDGTVFTWGESDRGGDSSSVSSQLSNVKEIYSTQGAFAALTTNSPISSLFASSTTGDGVCSINF